MHGMRKRLQKYPKLCEHQGFWSRELKQVDLTLDCYLIELIEINLKELQSNLLHKWRQLVCYFHNLNKALRIEIFPMIF